LCWQAFQGSWFSKAHDCRGVSEEAEKWSGCMMQTPWDQARRKTRSMRQEERLGQMSSGKAQVNSGRHWRWKRDGIVHEFLIEARTTEADSYRIERKEFLDIQKQALQTPPGLLPGMQIDIGSGATGISGMFIRTQDFQDMYVRLIELEELVKEI
jgi:hypothetical protein